MSNETKWTPGPWVARTNGYYWQVDPENKSEKDPFQVCDVCSSQPHHPEGGLQEANARLIAAAPELYDALEAIIKGDSKIVHRERMRAVEVLAKARGEIE